MRGMVWIPVIALLAVAAAALDEERGIRTWFRLQREVAAAEQRIALISKEIEEQKVLVEALESDPFAIERAIREELRYARAGETVVRLRPVVLATPQND